MHLFLTSLSDVITLMVVIPAQWRLGRMFLRHATRRYSARGLRLAKIVLAFYAMVLASGLLLDEKTTAELSLAPVFSGWLRAITLMWAFSSSFAVIAYSIIYGAVQYLWRGRERSGFDPGKRRLLQAAGGVAIGAPLVAVGFGSFVQRTDFHVREVDIPVTNLPVDLEGVRLLQLSDIHLSMFLSEKEFARVIDAAQETRPNVTLVTGDLISMHGDPLDACLRQLARLRPDAGILGCLGNHEVYAGAESYATAQASRLGIQFLRNQARRLRFGHAELNFAGVDYQRMNRKPHYLEGADKLIVPGAVNILLSHNPDVFPVAARQGYDLTLSGHTHGGQVNVEILHQNLNMARFYTPFVYGLYRSQSASIYVTRGIGTIGVPARLGAPPEISVLRLTKSRLREA